MQYKKKSQIKSNENIHMNGTVLRTFSGFMDIKIERPLVCKRCRACFKNKARVIKLPVEAPFQKGDSVSLDITCMQLYKISVLLYFMPTLFIIIGFSTGYYLFGNIGGLTGAVITFLLGFKSIKLYLRNNYKNLIKIRKQDA